VTEEAGRGEAEATRQELLRLGLPEEAVHTRIEASSGADRGFFARTLPIWFELDTETGGAARQSGATQAWNRALQQFAGQPEAEPTPRSGRRIEVLKGDGKLFEKQKLKVFEAIPERHRSQTPPRSPGALKTPPTSPTRDLFETRALRGAKRMDGDNFWISREKEGPESKAPKVRARSTGGLLPHRPSVSGKISVRDPSSPRADQLPTGRTMHQAALQSSLNLATKVTGTPRPKVVRKEPGLVEWSKPNHINFRDKAASTFTPRTRDAGLAPKVGVSPPSNPSSPTSKGPAGCTTPVKTLNRTNSEKDVLKGAIVNRASNGSRSSSQLKATFSTPPTHMPSFAKLAS